VFGDGFFVNLHFNIISCTLLVWLTLSVSVLLQVVSLIVTILTQFCIVSEGQNAIFA